MMELELNVFYKTNNVSMVLEMMEELFKDVSHIKKLVTQAIKMMEMVYAYFKISPVL